ncbi:phospholipid scramblase 2-like [Ambystoma mexicanum]|uniref:phospholipid scramblase 2-like n=1 Tax=Ambystoma mexicanum TaxID=8296 RepID=UPI0037E841FA
MGNPHSVIHRCERRGHCSLICAPYFLGDCCICARFTRKGRERASSPDSQVKDGPSHPRLKKQVKRAKPWKSRVATVALGRNHPFLIKESTFSRKKSGRTTSKDPTASQETSQGNMPQEPNTQKSGPLIPRSQVSPENPQSPPDQEQGRTNASYQYFAGGQTVPPISNQPQAGQAQSGMVWMPPPPVPLNCPPGLEYLSQIDQLLIHQQIELLEILTGLETNNKYVVKNSLGQQIYFAAEQNDFCTRNCCGPARPFTITIIDNVGREVIRISRPYRCVSCCPCACCLQELEVQAPPGTTVGYVAQNWRPCLPKFTILNEKREEVLKIKGPCVSCSCSFDFDFQLLALDETTEVGKISKQWSGFLREAFTDADNFGIQFPVDLDVKMKAVVLGACFLIDFMFFEHSQNNLHAL